MNKWIIAAAAIVVIALLTAYLYTHDVSVYAKFDIDTKAKWEEWPADHFARLITISLSRWEQKWIACGYGDSSLHKVASQDYVANAYAGAYRFVPLGTDDIEVSIGPEPQSGYHLTSGGPEDLPCANEIRVRTQ